MNVLIVASKFPPEYSGPGVRIPRLYDAIANQIGIKNIYVYCNGIEQAKNEDYIFNGYQVRRRTLAALRACPAFLPQRVRNALTYFFETIQGLWELRQYADKNISYIHLIGHSGGTAAALWWARRKKIPILIELVNSTAKPVQKFLFAFSVKPSAPYKVVAISSALEQEAIKCGISAENIWTRPNPVDESVFFPDPENKYTHRADLMPFGPKDIVISYVAKFMPRKNQIFLVDVLSHLPPSYKLVLAGPIVKNGPLQERDKAYFSDMTQKIECLGLKDRVFLKTEYVEPDKYMKASDIYALPAWDEGLGTPMLEALACGIPVIANKEEPSFQEWIKDGENGFLCDISSPESWARTIENSRDILMKTCSQKASVIRDQAGQIRIYENYGNLIKKLAKKVSIYQ